MNALEKAQLRITHKDRVPVNPIKGERYHVAWASPKYKKMRVTLISTFKEKAVVLTPNEKRIVMDIKDLRLQEEEAIKNAIERVQKEKTKTFKQRKLNFLKDA